MQSVDVAAPVLTSATLHAVVVEEMAACIARDPQGLFRPQAMRASVRQLLSQLHEIDPDLPSRALTAAQARQPVVTSLRLVILESPYAGDIDGNIAYGRRCLRDSLQLGEAPIASHLLYTQPGVLKDEDPQERKLGIEAGLAWRSVAKASVVYCDRGISEGMAHGIAAAKASGIPVEYRYLDDAAEARP